MALDTIIQAKWKRGLAVCNMSNNDQAKRIKIGGHHIPLDITKEILLRLPVRSLLRFRRVCKLWCSITYDPYFIDAHLCLQRACRIPAILFFPTCNNKNGRPGITYLDDDSNSLSAPKPYFPRPKPSDLCTFLRGSCNGILCITGNLGNIQLLNPLTGESLTPPEPTPCSHRPVVHFGFHPLTKEYKVLRFFVRSPFQQFIHRKECEVYTLGTSSWRPNPTILENVPLRCGVTVKGVMYWKTLKADSIPCFDLSDERFTSISLPDFMDIYQGGEYKVGSHLEELQDSVCLPVFRDASVGSDEVLTQMDVWALVTSNHHNIITHEWARKYSVRFPHGGSLPRLVRFPYGDPTPRPLLIHDEKILVFKINKYRRKLDVRMLQYLRLPNGHLGYGGEQVGGSSESFEQVVVDEHSHRWDPWVHVESLVSIPRPLR